MRHEFPVTKTTTPKAKPDSDTLAFGNRFTDHMFLMDYNQERGWYDGRIVPYGPICLDPAASVFHYGQELFEGLKAYKTSAGNVRLFRPEKNEERTKRGCERICIPPLPDGIMVEAVKALVDVERDWIPDKPNTSLYIRPFIIATEPFIGVRDAHNYLFVVILSPVGPYYKEGLSPTRIFVEDKYVRSVKGGTGEVKVGGNYAVGLRSEKNAHEKGYAQVLWLDGIERRYVEEIGTSNAFFVIDGEVVTSPLTGTILPGITRDSVMTLLRSWGVSVSERRLSIEDLYEAHRAGRLSEVFASGTAAVISPVGELCWGDKQMIINEKCIGTLSQKLYDELTGIQYGRIEDRFGWITEIE